MPKQNSGGTNAGSSKQSDTANQASATNQATTNSQNQIQRTGSPSDNLPHYASGYYYDLPPNGGIPHGILEDPNTGRQYILPEPPLGRGSTAPPQNTPYFAIYEYNGPDSPRGPAIYLDASCGYGNTTGPRLTLTHTGLTYRPYIYQHSGAHNAIDQPH